MKSSISPASHDLKKNRIYLSTLINALVEGIYKENISKTELKKQGDLGLDTFNQLDGGMALFDGQFYRIALDGNISILECSIKKVQAEIQFFYTLELSLPHNMDYLTWDFNRDVRGDLDQAEK